MSNNTAIILALLIFVGLPTIGATVYSAAKLFVECPATQPSEAAHD